jgi:hypothetical protein
MGLSWAIFSQVPGTAKRYPGTQDITSPANTGQDIRYFLALSLRIEKGSRGSRYFDGVLLKIFSPFTARFFAAPAGNLIFAIGSPLLVRRRRKWQFMLPRVAVSVSRLR